jgi:hypothetical protein
MKPTYTIWCLAVLASLVLLTGTVFSQGVTTAAINGKVTAKTGEALPGVNIVAIHDPSGTKYGNSTREDGRFTVPNLRVGGPYTITASIIGYQKQTRTNVYLRLGENFDLNFSMTEEAVQAGEITVLGERTSVFNSSRTGGATNVTREQLDKLPTINRNFQEALKLSPYFTEGNALGRNNRYNNIQIDGANFNDLYGLGATGAPGGQGPGKIAPVSLDAIEEFQVVVSPYDVRQGNFTGAGVNAISRSGTNSSQGSIYYYGRNEDIAGKTPTKTGERKKLDGFKDWQYGFRSGGAIVENSLFYFVNGEFSRFNQPILRTFGQDNLGTNAFTVNADSLNMLTSYLKTKYNYDPGSWSEVPNYRETDKIFTRLDFNLGERHKLTARWSFVRMSEDNSPSRGRSITDIYAENGRYRLDNKTHNVGLQLASTLSNTTSNELILGYVDQFDNPIYYGSPFPSLYISSRDTNKTYRGPQVLVLGAEEFRHRNELGQKYFEITDNFSWYLPAHTVTAGVRVDFLTFRNLFIGDNFGAYTYNSISDFLNDRRAASYTFKYSATSDPLQETRWGARQYGFYVQDEWTVSSALKLTAGVRVDIPTYPDKPLYNPRVDTVFSLRTDLPPKTSPAFSPRIGFNYAFDEERTMQVRGGVGIFYGRFPYVWVGNQYANTGMDFVTITTVPTKFNPDPFGQTKVAASSTATYEINLTDRNFKAPSVIRGTLAFDYKLPFDFVASVEGIYSVTQNDAYYENINLRGMQTNGGLTPDGRLVGENREVWGVWSSTANRYEYTNTSRTKSAGYLPKDSVYAPGVFLIKNTSKGSNANVIVQVQRSVVDGLNGGVAYTWGQSKDINSGNSTTASSGWRFNPTPGNPNAPQLSFSQWDRTHHISANLSYRHLWGTSGLATSVGVYYNGISGRPFSYMVTGDVNGDGRSDNDLVYIPKDANDIILVTSTGTILPKTDAAYTSLFAYIAADKYLNANKGKMSERSGPREPWSHEINLHIGQEIPTFSGQRIEFTFDILNLMNLFNKDWGWVRNTGANQTVNMLQFYRIETAAGADRGKPKYTWLNLPVNDGKADPFVADNLLSRWQAQFGIRYTF